MTQLCWRLEALRAPMRRVDFFQLARAMQERFLAGAAGEAAPRALLFRPLRRPVPWFWLFGVLVSLGLLAGMLVDGFGSLESPRALASPVMMAAYGAAIWLFSYCLARALGALTSSPLLPFRPGTYLFPVGVIVARSARLVVHPLSELDRVEPAGSKRIRLRFSGGRSFDFEVPDSTQREALVTSAQRGRQDVIRLEAEHNDRELATLDPLLDPKIPTPLLSTIPHRRQISRWPRLALLVAVLPAIGFAWPVYRIRNVMSERAMFAAAQGANTPEAYRAYLARGGQRAEVPALLLPRSELAVAQREGKAEVVAEVVERYRNQPIQGELELALRELLLADLAKVRRKGSLTALRQFAERIPRRDLVQPEIDAAIRAVYAKALEDYRKQAPSDRPELRPFFEALIKYAEKHGPRVEIRFVREIRKSVPNADKVLKKSNYFAGPAYLPAQYFDARNAAPRERRLADDLIARFQKLFPKDVLTFVLGKPVDAATEPAPAFERPTLFIKHSTLMSGTYITRRPLAAYVGVGVLFESSFQIPSHSTSLDYQRSVWRTPDVDKVQAEKMPPKAVYDEMANEAFDRFREKLVTRFFQGKR